MKDRFNLIICGLAGQGVAMCSKILSTALANMGKNVLATDIPSVTHRHALTIGHIRWGQDVYSNRISEGEADLLLAIEPFQGLQVGLHYMNRNGAVLINDWPIETRYINSQDNVRYPSFQEICGYLVKSGVEKVYPVKATQLALKTANNSIAANMVTLGIASGNGLVPTPVQVLRKTIEQLSPPGSLAGNLAAFDAGVAHKVR